VIEQINWVGSTTRTVPVGVPAEPLTVTVTWNDSPSVIEVGFATTWTDVGAIT
jgi:hypothetical protein